MNKRLQQFLTLEQLSPSKFADILGIQRSGISHILSGRNKPSYDFIERMLLKFPNINAEWLILGKGKPYKNAPSEENPKEESIDLFSTPTDNQYVTPENEKTELPENPIFQQQLPDTPQISSPTKGNKKILRITIFYNDGSFEDR